MLNQPRTCRYNHGPLQLLPDWFAMQGVQPQPALGATLLNMTYEYRPTPGQVLALRVWRCPACGYVELVDQEP